MRPGYSRLLCLLAIAAAFFTMAEGANADSTSVSDAWIRTLPASLPSGAYFNLQNGSDRTVVLVGTQSPACGMLMLHKSTDRGGMTSMEDVTAIDVPAGTTVSFKPVGYHLICMGTKPVIKPGAKIPVTLSFQDGHKITTDFDVRNAAGK